MRLLAGWHAPDFLKGDWVDDADIRIERVQDKDRSGGGGRYAGCGVCQRGEKKQQQAVD